MIALRCLGLLWSSPGILVLWAVYVLPLWLCGQLVRIPSGRFSVLAFQVADDAWGWYHRAWRGWGGFGAHAVVIFRGEPVERMWRHELRHTDQALVFGVLWGPLYVLGLLWGYRGNPFERDAMRAEKR
jgi:hypothetical protein